MEPWRFFTLAILCGFGYVSGEDSNKPDQQKVQTEAAFHKLVVCQKRLNAEEEKAASLATNAETCAKKHGKAELAFVKVLTTSRKEQMMNRNATSEAQEALKEERKASKLAQAEKEMRQQHASNCAKVVQVEQSKLKAVQQQAKITQRLEHSQVQNAAAVAKRKVEAAALETVQRISAAEKEQKDEIGLATKRVLHKVQSSEQQQVTAIKLTSETNSTSWKARTKKETAATQQQAHVLKKSIKAQQKVAIKQAERIRDAAMKEEVVLAEKLENLKKKIAGHSAAADVALKEAERYREWGKAHMKGIQASLVSLAATTNKAAHLTSKEKAAAKTAVGKLNAKSKKLRARSQLDIVTH